MKYAWIKQHVKEFSVDSMCRFMTVSQAKQAIFEYIEVFYNRERLHSANGYLSPADFELQHKAA